MYRYKCLNPIAAIGLDKFNDNYKATDNVEEADAIWFVALRCMRWNFRRTCLQ